MGNSLRCCLACVLPCGALDLIRIVHLNGRIEEYGRPVAAGEILAANPNHVLSKPCSQGVAVRRILIVAPDSELERGEIYFLIPAASVPPEKKRSAAANKSRRQLESSHGGNDRSSSSSVNKTTAMVPSCGDGKTTTSRPKSDDGRRRDLVGQQALSSSSRKKKLASSSSHRRRTSAGNRTAAEWKPHLECIVEDT